MFRLILEPAVEGRLRLDAGTWGTMGVGLGYAIAVATCTDKLVVAVEGDSAFGFSGMEVETISRHASMLPCVLAAPANIATAPLTCPTSTAAVLLKQKNLLLVSAWVTHK